MFAGIPTLTVDSEEVVGEGPLEELPLPGDLLVHGEELLHEGDDHAPMPAGNSCFSEKGKVRGAQVRA